MVGAEGGSVESKGGGRPGTGGSRRAGKGRGRLVGSGWMPGAEQTQAAGEGEQAHSPGACKGSSFQAFSVGSRAPWPHAPLRLCLLHACLEAGAGGPCCLPQRSLAAYDLVYICSWNCPHKRALLLNLHPLKNSLLLLEV